MEALLIGQIIYTQLTNNAHLRLRQLMQNNNPAGEMKKITEGEVRSIIGEPKECENRESVRICKWQEKNREVKITFNLIRKNTISKWTSRGF